MAIEDFMRSYQQAWEHSDEKLLSSLFRPDGCYHNTPFQTQTGHAEIEAYWQRTKLQRDIRLSYEIVHAHAGGGVAHWRTTYQVASEEMFAMWAAATGTTMIARRPGDPLPRLVLDGIALVELDDAGLCRHFRIWWHAVPEDQGSPSQ